MKEGGLFFFTNSEMSETVIQVLDTVERYATVAHEWTVIHQQLITLGLGSVVLLYNGRLGCSILLFNCVRSVGVPLLTRSLTELYDSYKSAKRALKEEGPELQKALSSIKDLTGEVRQLEGAVRELQTMASPDAEKIKKSMETIKTTILKLSAATSNAAEVGKRINGKFDMVSMRKCLSDLYLVALSALASANSSTVANLSVGLSIGHSITHNLSALVDKYQDSIVRESKKVDAKLELDDKVSPPLQVAPLSLLLFLLLSLLRSLLRYFPSLLLSPSLALAKNLMPPLPLSFPFPLPLPRPQEHRLKHRRRAAGPGEAPRAAAHRLGLPGHRSGPLCEHVPHTAGPHVCRRHAGQCPVSALSSVWPALFFLLFLSFCASLSWSLTFYTPYCPTLPPPSPPQGADIIVSALQGLLDPLLVKQGLPTTKTHAVLLTSTLCGLGVAYNVYLMVPGASAGVLGELLLAPLLLVETAACLVVAVGNQ